MLDLVPEAIRVLATADADAKAASARSLAAAWREGGVAFRSKAIPPDRPARGERPVLCRPGDMPRRKATGNQEKRVALLHALAHIELNAIDLAWDMIARFADDSLPRAFLEDWIRVGDEEALHFSLLAARLRELGMVYGDLPAHDGLWQAASETAHDLLARLAIVPLVLEARGLDVSPATIAELRRGGDAASADTLEIIYRDEIGHVAIGKRWFDHVASARGLDPQSTWQDLVRRHFRGHLKPPFNTEARDAAGFSAAFYAPLAKDT
ncbi:ferritin-like domain-containing protein [Dongia sp.]|uniref:ferritin-like domain-containing protein n=1 Tax=Dongia sp. TaxID=1977262 RepID=UPI0035B40827